MLSHALCAFIAPVLASAAAYPWALPEPTFAIPAIDSWSPAPTPAPNSGAFELFRRASEDTVCGFLSGISTSSLTCSGKSSVCATDTYRGVHGCCDPKDMNACSIPTTCIPSSLMSASCTDAQCSSNAYIAKCTGTEAPECYQWNFVYSTARTTTFKEWGCAAKPGTATVERTWNGFTSSSSLSSKATKTTSLPTSSDTPGASAAPLNQTPPSSNSKPNNTGVIVGGAIGGLVVIGAVASFIFYLFVRDRRLKREAAAGSWPTSGGNNTGGVAEYNPQGFAADNNAWHNDHKGGWNPNSSPVIVSECGPGRGDGGEGATLFGIVEAQGREVCEAPA